MIDPLPTPLSEDDHSRAAHPVLQTLVALRIVPELTGPCADQQSGGKQASGLFEVSVVGGDCHCNLAITIGLLVRIEAVERLPADQLVGTRIGGDENENTSLEKSSAETGIQVDEV